MNTPSTYEQYLATCEKLRDTLDTVAERWAKKYFVPADVPLANSQLGLLFRPHNGKWGIYVVCAGPSTWILDSEIPRAPTYTHINHMSLQHRIEAVRTLDELETALADAGTRLMQELSVALVVATKHAGH